MKMSALIPSGSATGNPRNKIALAPGKSLMDWVRLCNSGKDMTGTGGTMLNVSMEQLASHNKPSDAWLAIRGIVYNVTEYMSFHPGGEEELMRGAGTDATKLFNKVHPWVNYESLLKSCVIGRLMSISSSPTSSSVWNDSLEKPVNDRVMSLNSKLSAARITRVPSISDEVSNLVFKMDWFQQAASLTLIFYFKTSSTSPALPLEVSISLSQNKRLVIRIDNEVNVYELEEEVRWPCSVKVHQTVAEIKLTKQLPKLWSVFGKKLADSNETIPDYCRMKVIHVSNVTHDTKLLGFQYEKRIIHHMHVGHHVRFRSEIDGEEVVRSYTPVSFLTQTTAAFPEPTLFFLVKDYNCGKLSHKLCSLKANDFIDMSRPMGTFNCMALKKRLALLLFAAGTGLTPMTSLIIWTLNSTRLNVTLIYFNKTEDDIIWREEMNRLSSLNSRFQVKLVLSQPSPSWAGETGLVSEELLKSLLTNSIKDHYMCVCGPLEFNKLCTNYMVQCGCTEDDYYCFGEW